MQSARTGKAVANQFIINQTDNDFNCITFQSYDTKIATYDIYNSILVVYPEWSFSKTTSKYFFEFLRDLGLDYNTTKFRELEKSGGDHNVNNIQIIFN